MQLPVCFTIAELRHRLQFPRNPLELFQLINLYRPQTWRFLFSFNHHQRVDLDIECGLEEDLSLVISSGTLATLDCEQIDIQSNGQKFHCDWKHGLDYDPSDNVLRFESQRSEGRTSRLSLKGFGGVALPPEFGRWDAIDSFLRRHTWMGSYILPRAAFSVQVSVFNNRRTFVNFSPAADALAEDEAQGLPTLRLSHSLGAPVIGEGHLLASASQTDLVFRWSHSGIATQDELRQCLGIDLRSWPVKGELEVRFPGRTLGPDGTLANDEGSRSIADALRRLGAGLLDDARYLQYLRKCENFEKRTSAERIDRRKAELLHTDFIFCKGRLVYKAPTNEMETVALHQKLEGMGVLPFSDFVSLEYTPKLGIDAIVNFKIRPTESLHRFATVEFEYKLEAFVSHSHPVEQTDMIICWEGTGATSIGGWPYERDLHLPWLGYLHVGGKTITVAEASKYPELERHGLNIQR